MRRIFVAALVLVSVSLPSVLRAQITNVTNDQSTPIPGVGHDYIKMLSETVNPSNGSVSLRIQAPAPKGRLLTIPFGFDHDTNGVHHLTTNPNGSPIWDADSTAYSRGGWSYRIPLVTYVEGTQVVSNGLVGESSSCEFYSGFVYKDPSGGSHALGIAAAEPYSPGACQFPLGGVPNAGDDYYRASTPSAWGTPSATVVSADGTVYDFECTPCNANAGGDALATVRIEDRNGNMATSTSNNSTGAYTLTDTLERTLISISSFASSAGDTIYLSGLTNPYVVTWKTEKSDFTIPIDDLVGGCSVSANADSRTVVSTITLPNGQPYTFLYGTDDPNNSNPYGLLSKIAYPSGGWVKYAYGINAESDAFDTTVSGSNGQSQCLFLYGTPAVTQRTVSFDGSHVALQQTFAYSTSWNMVSGTWTTKTTTVTTNDMVSGLTSVTKYAYSSVNVPNPPYLVGGGANQVPVESTITYEDGGQNVLQTVTKTWQDQYLLTQEVITPTGISSGSIVDYSYGSGGQVTKKTEYDYGHSSPTRITTITYETFPNTPIYNEGPSIFDRPCKSVVTDGNNNPAAETDYLYDGGTALCGTPGSSPTSSASTPSGTHDETNYGSSSTNPRGNATTVTKQCFPSCTNAVTTYNYDETGQVLTSKDPCGNTACSDMTGTTHTTTYSYTDNYSSCGGAAPPAGSTNAYLTKATDPLGHITSYCYGYNDGQLRGTTDENGQTTTYAYIDSLDRLTARNFPDQGQTSYTYNDTPPTPSVTTTQLGTPSPSIKTVSVMDGVGHVTQSQITSVSPTITTTTTYTGLGQAYTVSNPHISTSSPTDGTTTYTYDPLGRTTNVTEQDGSNVSTKYSGNTATVTDEAGHQRETVTDGLGRLTSVTEDPGGLNYVTNYTYDALDNLLTVVQAGSHSRTFQYDSLSRLTSAVNPEITGTVSYTYDANGNLATKTAPAPNQTGSAQFTASMTYDALNRILSKTYTGGSPTAALSFTYDVSSVDSVSSLTNPVGRLVKDSAVSSAGTVSFYHDYDKMGRTAGVWECVPFNCPSTWSSSYHYDYAGNLTSYSDTTFAAYTQSFDGAGRLTNLTSTWPSGTPTTFATVNNFFPPGQVQEMMYENGLAVSNVYNPRLQPCRINFNSSAAVLTSCSEALPTGNLLDFAYGYNQIVNAPSDDGSVASWTATGRQTFSHNYKYDTVNRIASMTGSGGSCTALNWTYDPWGNREDQTAPPGGGTCLQPQFTYLSNNQISGYGYDSAGNLTSQNGATYTYDNENRLVSETTSGVTAAYLYDASGRRVQKTVGSNPPTFYEYNKDGQIYGWLAPGGRQLGYAYMNGQVLAQYQYGTTYFHHHDHLGSTRLVSELNQVIEQCNGYYPFGESDNNQCTPTANNDFTDTLFTGKERDSESNLDNFEARYLASSLGRFMSPDRPLVDQEAEDPQSWNLYPYVRNNPLRNVDPTGNACVSTDNGATFHDDDSGGQTCAQANDPKNNNQASAEAHACYWCVSTLFHWPTDQENRALKEAIDSGQIPMYRGEIPIDAEGIEALEELPNLLRLAKFSDILRLAASAKGNFGLGEATAEEAAELGKAWVGEGARVASDGKTLVSADGLRVYRPPSLKESLGKVQANFEEKVVAGGRPISNGHLDIK